MNIKYFLKVAVCLLAWVTAVPASSESIRTRAVPALYRTAGGLKQEVQVIIEHQGVSTQATVNFNGQVKNIRLSEGENICSFELDEIKNEQQIPLSVSYAGDTHQSAVTVKPVRHWQVNMVQHTHTDIGYTRSQMEILAEHLRYIDYALDYCDATDQYPDDAKFRWTCEIAWAVSEYLKCRPAEQVARLKKRVKEGRIELATMYLNFDELPDEQTLAASLYPLKQFREAGLRAEVAMQNDVNGIGWCFSEYFADAGVKYVNMGTHGHRALICFDKPTVFWWESPSGKKILTYRAEHYNQGNFWGVETGDFNRFETRVLDYLDQMEAKDYPFDIVAAQHSGYFTDNAPPSTRSCEMVKRWNEKYEWPKMRTAVASELFKEVETNYADRIQTIRGAWPDWWTDGFGSAARETAASRKTQSDMITVEGMLSMAALEGDDYVSSTRDELRRIHENLLFYDEHTFGAAESIRDPHCENSQVQWAEKGSYVLEALKSTQMMYETAIGRLQGNLYRSSRPVITFFNPAGWTRSALATVYIDFEIIPQDRAFRITDEDGKELDVQPLRSRMEGRYYAIWAENIPALGYKTYEIILEDGNAPVPAAPDFQDNIMENTWYRITFDTKKGGIASLIDKSSGKELVDTSSPWSLGGFIYESLEGDRHQMERKVFEKYSRHGLENVRFTGTAAGEVYNSVFYEGTSRGCDPEHGIRVEVKLFNHVKRIEISYSMKRLPETDPSGIYVAFPISMQESKLAFDVPGGVVNAGENQIPRTATAWNTVQNFVSARNGDSQIILSCDAVPLFMMGELLNDPYRLVHRHENAHVFSWVMNNYWTTNFRASQEGELTWTYAITTADGSSNSDASRFGWGNRIPVYARVIPASATANSNARSVSFLNHDVDNVLMTSCVPSRTEPDGVLINLRETDGKEADFRLYDRSGHPVPFTVVNILDENIGGETESVKHALRSRKAQNVR